MLPVLLLTSSASTAVRQRTVESVARQSVEVVLCHTPVEALATSSEYVVLVLAGAELAATACERAVWFLATRPGLACVSGAAGADSAALVPLPLDCIAQFLVVRRTHVQRLLDAERPCPAATAAALAIGLHRDVRCGAGWLAETVLTTSAAAAVAPVLVDARRSLAALGLEEAALVEMAASGIPLQPQQRLAAVEHPSLTARLAPTSGLRILMLVQGFPMGGYTAFNAELLPRLVGAGHAVTTCMTEFWRTEWRLDLVRAVAPDIHHVLSTVPAMAMPAYLDWLIISRRIDVVLLSHSYAGLHLLPYLRARHPDVAFVDYVHTDWFESAMYGSYAAMAERWTGQLDAQLATSHSLVEQLTSQGCDADAVRAAHIGIDTQLWQHRGPRLAAVRASLGATSDTLLLLFSGRLSPEKRPQMCIEMLAALLAERRDAALVFAGGGQLMQALREQIDAAGLADRCKLLGELDEDTLRHVYAAADVFIAPSEIEGVSRSLYEAMAMGCVPVVSDVGGQRELVTSGTGSLVNAAGADAARYLEGVRPWLDPIARASASLAAREMIAANFDSYRTTTIVCETLMLARARRRMRQDTLPPAMAEELAVMSIETMRRHVLRSVGR